MCSDSRVPRRSRSTAGGSPRKRTVAAPRQKPHVHERGQDLPARRFVQSPQALSLSNRQMESWHLEELASDSCKERFVPRGSTAVRTDLDRHVLMPPSRRRRASVDAQIVSGCRWAFDVDAAGGARPHGGSREPDRRDAIASGPSARDRATSAAVVQAGSARADDGPASRFDRDLIATWAAGGVRNDFVATSAVAWRSAIGSLPCGAAAATPSIASNNARPIAGTRPNRSVITASCKTPLPAVRFQIVAAASATHRAAASV